jgi:hypothetical protein
MSEAAGLAHALPLGLAPIVGITCRPAGAARVARQPRRGRIERYAWPTIMGMVFLVTHF